MATNGIISIIDENGKTLVKCIAGCDGYNAKKVSEILLKTNTLDIEDIYKKCLGLFGCLDCLVVMNAEWHMYAKEKFSNLEYLDQRYSETFLNPNTNPRWKIGTSAYLEIIKYSSE